MFDGDDERWNGGEPDPLGRREVFGQPVASMSREALEAAAVALWVERTTFFPHYQAEIAEQFASLDALHRHGRRHIRMLVVAVALNLGSSLLNVLT